MTTKVLLTLPIRLPLGLVALVPCVGILALCVILKTICMPTEPLLDYRYLDCSDDPPCLLGWWRSTKAVYNWIIYGTMS